MFPNNLWKIKCAVEDITKKNENKDAFDFRVNKNQMLHWNFNVIGIIFQMLKKSDSQKYLRRRYKYTSKVIRNRIICPLNAMNYCLETEKIIVFSLFTDTNTLFGEERKKFFSKNSFDMNHGLKLQIEFRIIIAYCATKK